MKNLELISLEDLFELLKGKTLLGFDSLIEEKTKESLRNLMGLYGVCSSLEKLKDVLWRNVTFVATENFEDFFENVFEKFSEEKCAYGTDIRFFEQEKVYRLIGADPIEFFGKVKGLTGPSKSHPKSFMVIKSNNNNFLVFRISPETKEVRHLRPHKNQDDLPEIN
ncbi:MAG: hypothetical protein KC516_02045 [Nanoarchaeota archaeon]|nr:hypothetical protein [Nanoarchaeota archaeon]